MLAEPERTRFDLNFRLFGFPVRVHPLFWLVIALFGSSALEHLGPAYFLAWVVVAFVSILVHEFGHAIAFKIFKVDSHVVLHAFGGLAIPWSRVPVRWQRIVVSLAGPAAGFLLFGIVYASHLLTGWGVASPIASWFFLQLIFVNVAWGLMNLLPVFPLDGGQVCEEVCSHFSRWRGREIALQISIAVAALACAYSLICVMSIRQGAEWIAAMPWWIPLGSFWTAILFGILGFQSYQLLQFVKANGSNWDRP